MLLTSCSVILFKFFKTNVVIRDKACLHNNAGRFELIVELVR